MTLPPRATAHVGFSKVATPSQCSTIPPQSASSLAQGDTVILTESDSNDSKIAV
jgi:hypothetical protein